MTCRGSNGAAMGDPTGEALRLDFDRRLLLRFRGFAISSDAGLLAYRELDDVLGLTDTGAETLADARTGKNGRHRLAGLLRQSVFGRLAGYEDVNNAERLFRDPAMRWVVGDRATTGSAASASQMGRFETKWLSRPENVAALADLLGQWIERVHQLRPPKMIVLDRDSSESPTYGEQEGSAYNGHFGCTCYHPLFMFNQFGDVERCVLRPGNVHSDWRVVLEPVIARYRGSMKRLYFRRDAAFASPEIYEFLEAEGIGYTIRAAGQPGLPRQDQDRILAQAARWVTTARGATLLCRLGYRAQSWNKSRHVVAKVEWHPGELYPRVGFIVTNPARSAEGVIAFYNQRGTSEQYIKEGKGAIKWTRLSCRTFAANAVRLQLHALTYSLGNFMRALAMLRTAERWSLTGLGEKLIKIGAKVVSHGRYVTFQMAEVAVPRQMFAEILSLIARLGLPPAPA
jgi:hypothetical protein